MDSPGNRSIALAVCLGYGGQSPMFYALRLAGLEEKLVNTLANITSAGIMLAAIFWLAQKPRKEKPSLDLVQNGQKQIELATRSSYEILY